MLKLFGAKKKERSSHIHQISEHMFRFGESLDDDHSFCLSYFLVGTFGNYLLGLPNDMSEFTDFIESRGGVAFIISSHRLYDVEEQQRLFRRYGAHWIWPEEDAIMHAPIASWRGAYPSLKIERVEQSAWQCQWWGNFRDQDFYFGEALAAQHENRRQLPRFAKGSGLGGDGTTVERTPMQAIVSPSHEAAMIAQSLSGDASLVVWNLPSSPLIACYDDFFFERHDVDMLGPQQRQQISDGLSAMGLKQLRGNRWQSRDGHCVDMVKPARLLSQESVAMSSVLCDRIWLLTATQLAFVLVRLFEFDGQRCFESLKQLVSQIPINLPKLQAEIQQSSQLLNQSKEHWSDITLLQEQSCQHFKKWRVDGLRGKARRDKAETGPQKTL